ncbi:MAG TPA: UvrB/UvrC motif-containing protein, partial [Acidimicrobiales bacterium]|nr:UvrB/UvrC motif-containing protein [Acidimicrobiales bacterium]
MTRAISETQRRRALQETYNIEHGIDPQTIRKAVTDILASIRGTDSEGAPVPGRDRRSRRRDRMRSDFAELPSDELTRLIQTLEEEMHEAAADLRFEYAARLRDEISDLKGELREVAGSAGPSTRRTPVRS